MFGVASYDEMVLQKEVCLDKFYLQSLSQMAGIKHKVITGKEQEERERKESRNLIFNETINFA